MTSRTCLTPDLPYRDIQFDAWFSSRWSEPRFAKNYEDDDITKVKWWVENINDPEAY